MTTAFKYEDESTELSVTIKMNEVQRTEKLLILDSLFVLNSAIESDSHRADMLKTYRGALQQLYPILGLLFEEPDFKIDSTSLDKSVEAGMQQIQKILSGQHEWSRFLEHENYFFEVDPDIDPQHFANAKAMIFVRPTLTITHQEALDEKVLECTIVFQLLGKQVHNNNEFLPIETEIYP